MKMTASVVVEIVERESFGPFILVVNRVHFLIAIHATVTRRRHSCSHLLPL
jgi:hypothetical protein